MLEMIKSLISDYVHTTTFAVSLALLFLSVVVGALEYHLMLNKRIKKRYADGVLLLDGVVCGIVFAVFASIEFYPVLLGMFKVSLIGVRGDNIMPHIYTVIPLLCCGTLFGVFCYEVAKYSGQLKKWFLRLYRKNHKMYITR